jgi:hypothetical protein
MLEHVETTQKCINSHLLLDMKVLGKLFKLGEEHQVWTLEIKLDSEFIEVVALLVILVQKDGIMFVPLVFSCFEEGILVPLLGMFA